MKIHFSFTIFIVGWALFVIVGLVLYSVFVFVFRGLFAKTPNWLACFAFMVAAAPLLFLCYFVTDLNGWKIAGEHAGLRKRWVPAVKEKRLCNEDSDCTSVRECPEEVTVSMEFYEDARTALKRLRKLERSFVPYERFCGRGGALRGERSEPLLCDDGLCVPEFSTVKYYDL
jgi:hypothetical protein